MNPAKYCSIRHGTKLDSYVSKNVFRSFPLEDKLLEILDWDGKSPLPHRFYNLSSESRRMNPQVPFNKGYLSVTTLISCISPKEALYKWQLDQVKQLGFAGFKAKNIKRMNGSSKMHKLLENRLREFCIGEGKIKPVEQILEENDKNGGAVPIEYLHSILPFFNDVLKEVKENKEICFEQMVYNHRLIYRGKFDAILPIKGELTLIDWKGCSVGTTKAQRTPEDAELSIDNKMQLAAYVAAINSDKDFGHIPKISRAAIVNIFESGREAELIMMDEEELKEAYEQFKGWLNLFWWKMATEKAQLDKNGDELISFCYEPPQKKKE